MTIIKEHGVLFNGEMVRATLDDLKTQTRRCITRMNSIIHNPNGCPIIKWDNLIWNNKDVSESMMSHFQNKSVHVSDDGNVMVLGCIESDEIKRYMLRNITPHWKIGDRLYVRENWAIGKGYEGVKPSDLSPESIHLMKKWFPADGTPKPDWAGKTRPSIHMPRLLSRQDLEITGIKHERIGDISDQDLIAEGLMPRDEYEKGWLKVDVFINMLSMFLHPEIDNQQERLSKWIRAFTFKRVSK